MALSQKKRIVMCCDGTWMNSDTGYSKPTIWNPVSKLQPPSNVTRLSRSLRRICTDGTIQIIEYQSGLGTAGTMSDLFTGGAFGRGVSEGNVRSAYSFLCANYCDGDEIILIGFSRGAFTARSVAGMVAHLGLLTREGLEFFYPIYKDMQNWRTVDYEDPFPNIPFPDKPRGENAPDQYRQRLLDKRLTRVNETGGKGKMIKVKADTVGSLGIPNTTLLAKIGLNQSTKEFRFFNTTISDRVEYAFQALALDEHRLPFSPTLWERTAANRGETDLRQVWFPGNHGNVGGGWQDQGVANMSLAWMMDQLASVGVEFDEATINRLFTRLAQSYRELAKNPKPKPALPPPTTSEDPEADDDEPESGSGACCGLFNKITPHVDQWAIDPIYSNNKPVRPWSLGAILGSEGFMFKMSGYNLRTPGLYKKVDPNSGRPTAAFLEDTGERIHSSVRTRLALKGLGLNDESVWDAPALKGHWRLRKTVGEFPDPIPPSVKTWEPLGGKGVANLAKDESGQTTFHNWFNLASTQTVLDDAIENQRPLQLVTERGYRWVWEFHGSKKHAPPQTSLLEEPLGPYERQLLRLSGGTPNVYEFAEKMDIKKWWQEPSQ